MRGLFTNLWAMVMVFALSAVAFAADKDAILEKTTVTAQKVEEDISNVPISMSLLNEIDIEDKGIRTVSDIAQYVPNFNQFSVGGAGMYTPSMRGLTTDVHTLSTTIGTYVDGIPYISSMGNNITLEDIERIEVLRGPQGTIYGKNAYAGVLNIITKKPGNTPTGKVAAILGTDKKQEYSFRVSGPIAKDKLFVGLSAKHYQKNGYIRNEFADNMDDDRRDSTAKVYLRYTPTEDLELSLITTYLKKNDGATAMSMIGAPDYRKTNSNNHGYTKSESIAHAFKVNYKMGSTEFSSVSTYKTHKDLRASDFDFSPMDMMHSKVTADYENYSQEFRLNGGGDKFRWITGVYLDKDEQKPFYTMNGRTNTDTKTTVSSLGLFANFDYNVTQKLIATAGLRYDRDKSETEDFLNPYEADKSYEEISPKVGLKYIVSDKFMTYATVAKGYKMGGYYMMAPSNDLKSYDKETLWNYEVGFKSKSLNDKLMLNMSMFYMDVDDMQVSSNVTPYRGYISNAATAKTYGLELESSFKVTKSFDVYANFGYSKAETKDFKDALGDYSGNDVPYAPKYNYSIGGKYRGDQGIFAMLNVSGQDKFYADKANKMENDGYATANAKIGYETENYEIYLYCNNLTDKEYDLEGYFGSFVMVSPPRETGVSFAYRF